MRDAGARVGRADLTTVILALDGDNAGREGRRRLWLELSGRGIEVLSLPVAALDGCKDLGEYWQRHHTMPTQLMARAIGPHLPSIGTNLVRIRSPRQCRP